MNQTSLKKFAYLSIAAAVMTIGLKFGAYLLTGSMGLFSDALESCVNLIAAVIALIMITISEGRPIKNMNLDILKLNIFQVQSKDHSF